MRKRWLMRFAFIQRLVKLDKLKRDADSARQIADLFRKTQGAQLSKWTVEQQQFTADFNKLRFWWMKSISNVQGQGRDAALCGTSPAPEGWAATRGENE